LEHLWRSIPNAWRSLDSSSPSTGCPWAPLRTPYDIAFKRAVTMLLAFTGYILMAWYDVWYDCNDHLKPTFLGWISAPFKPAAYQKGVEDLPVKWQKIAGRWIL